MRPLCNNCNQNFCAINCYHGDKIYYRKLCETCLKRKIKIKPNNYYAWEKLLLVYLQKKDYDNLYKKGEECATLFNRSYLAKILFANGAIEKGEFDIALDELIINEKIDESDIITGAKNVPNIWYYDEDGKQRRHFVDIFIPSQNRCIEVKSTWTFNKPHVLCKQKAAKELGYKYEIWVYDKKGNKNCYD